MQWLPVGLCLAHHLKISSLKQPIDAATISAVQSRITESPIAVRNAAQQCRPSNECLLCRQCAAKRQDLTPPPAAPLKRPAEFQVLQPKPKRIRRDKKSPATAASPPPKLDRLDSIAMGSAAKLSGHQIAKQADALNSRYATGSTSITAESGSNVRKQRTQLNRTFRHDFDTKRCPYSLTNEGIVLCCDIVDFVELYCWLREKSTADISLIKVNGDDGKQSLKLMLQFIFAEIQCWLLIL